MYKNMILCIIAKQKMKCMMQNVMCGIKLSLHNCHSHLVVAAWCCGNNFLQEGNESFFELKQIQKWVGTSYACSVTFT